MIPRTARLHIRSRASAKGAAIRAKRQDIEGRFQENAVDFLNAVLPDDVWFTAFPAGGGGKIRGAILKRRGLKPGVPDILIVQHGRLYGIELKAPKGVISGDQTNTHADLVTVGVPVAVCRTLDGIHEALTRWGLKLKGRLAA